MFLEDRRRPHLMRRKPPDPNIGSHLPPPPQHIEPPPPTPPPPPPPPADVSNQQLVTVQSNLNFPDELVRLRLQQDGMWNPPEMHPPRPLEYTPISLETIFNHGIPAPSPRGPSTYHLALPAAALPLPHYRDESHLGFVSREDGVGNYDEAQQQLTFYTQLAQRQMDALDLWFSERTQVDVRGGSGRSIDLPAQTKMISPRIAKTV